MLTLIALFVSPILSAKGLKFNSSACASENPGKSCIDLVKQQAADPDLFWFGDRWRFNCGSKKSAERSWIDCYNPPSLQHLTSLTSRLLHVPTYDPRYLQYLEFFPQAVFTSQSGSYPACDHLFKQPNASLIRAQPWMVPATPWSLRNEPEIYWQGLTADPSHYTILIMDVGFGKVHYLSYNFPHHTELIFAYREPLNFRQAINPVAIVVLRQPNGRIYGGLNLTGFEPAGVFNLRDFMINNKMIRGLVGLNWILVDYDPYAVEKQRRDNFVDNCPALILNAFITLQRSLYHTHAPPFLPAVELLYHVDAWMTATFETEPRKFNICCESYSIGYEAASTDSLGDRRIEPVYMTQQPFVHVRFGQSLQEQPSLYEYRRSGRDHISLLDDRKYMLVLIDSTPRPEHGSPRLPFVQWLLANIPAAVLSESLHGSHGDAFLPYLPPRPCAEYVHRYYLLLLEQTGGDIDRFDTAVFSQKKCQQTDRCFFDLTELVARHKLRLRAVAWFRSTQDSFLRYERTQWGYLESQVCKNIEGYQKPCPQRKEVEFAMTQSRSCSISVPHYFSLFPVLFFLFFVSV